MGKRTVTCKQCGKDFQVWNSWLKKGAGKCCSVKCSALSRLGRPSYSRTADHKKKMSMIKKGSSFNSICSARLTEINSLRKGHTWIEIFGNERAEQIRKKFRVLNSGSNNGNYIDGRSFLPYPSSFTKLLKEKIILRDKFVCRGCGKHHDEISRTDIFGRGLTIHHIDYNKNNCDEGNLIALCRSCNSRANGEREYYREYYGQQI